MESKRTSKLKPICSFSCLTCLRALVAQVKARVSMIMEPSTRHKKIQRRTINCTRSLWTWVCACPGFVADVTDPFDHNSSETMGNHSQSNTCPTPLKSPTQTMGLKRYRNSAYCLHSQNKRSRGLCHGCKRYPRQCAVSKACQREDAFFARLHGEKSKLAAICRKCNVCTRQTWKKSYIYPQIHWLKNVRRHIVTSTKVKKDCTVPLIRDFQSCQGQSPSSFAKIRRLHNCSTPMAWSHRPPCQAPGLSDSDTIEIGNFIAFQVNVRNRLVDFQCFDKGLWTNDGKSCEGSCATWELTRRSATLT